MEQGGGDEKWYVNQRGCRGGGSESKDVGDVLQFARCMEKYFCCQ